MGQGHQRFATVLNLSSMFILTGETESHFFQAMIKIHRLLFWLIEFLQLY